MNEHDGNAQTRNSPCPGEAATFPPETKRHFDSGNESQQLRYTFPSLLEPARCRVQVKGSRRAAGTPKEKGGFKTIRSRCTAGRLRHSSPQCGYGPLPDHVFNTLRFDTLLGHPVGGTQSNAEFLL